MLRVTKKIGRIMTTLALAGFSIFSFPQSLNGGEAKDGLSNNTASKAEKLWDFPLKGAAFGSATVADLDGDGKPEIVFGTYFGESKTYCVEAATGKVKWTCDVERGPIDDSVVVADATGDGKPDVLFAGSASAEVFCLHGDGKVAWKINDNVEGETFDGAIAVSDVTGDGKADVLIGSGIRKWPRSEEQTGVLYCREGATGKVIWKTERLKGWLQSSVLLWDLDGDGLEDAIVTTWRGDNTVQAFRGKDGKHLWTYKAGGWMYHGPSLGDIDGDGKPELAVAGYDNTLHILNLKGEKIQTVDLGENVLAPTTMHDLNDDGKMEILVSTCGGNVIALDGKGRTLWKTQAGPDCIWRGVVVAEFDGNEGLELLVQSCGNDALVALNPKDGKELWHLSIKENVKTDKDHRACSAAVVADFDGDGLNDVFFTGSGDLQNQFGHAIAFKGKGKGQTWTTFQGSIKHLNRIDK